MTAKVLTTHYQGEGNATIVRIYMENDFEQAEQDLKMIHKHVCDGKTWELVDAEIYGTK